MLATREKRPEPVLISVGGGRVSLHIYTFSLPFVSAYLLSLSKGT